MSKVLRCEDPAPRREAPQLRAVSQYLLQRHPPHQSLLVPIPQARHLLYLPPPRAEVAHHRPYRVSVNADVHCHDGLDDLHPPPFVDLPDNFTHRVRRRQQALQPGADAQLRGWPPGYGLLRRPRRLVGDRRGH